MRSASPSSFFDVFFDITITAIDPVNAVKIPLEVDIDGNRHECVVLERKSPDAAV